MFFVVFFTKTICNTVISVVISPSALVIQSESFLVVL